MPERLHRAQQDRPLLPLALRLERPADLSDDRRWTARRGSPLLLLWLSLSSIACMPALPSKNDSSPSSRRITSSPPYPPLLTRRARLRLSVSSYLSFSAAAWASAAVAASKVSTFPSDLR